MMKKPFFVLFVALCMTLPLMAEKSLIGKWQSVPQTAGMEKVVEIIHFQDESHLELSFVTDKNIPHIVQIVSTISIDGTYQMYGPMLFVKLKQPSVRVTVDKLELSETYVKSLPSGIGMDEAKKIVHEQVLEQSKLMFIGQDELSMIYVTHDDADIISFIIGNEQNAKEIEFHRVK